MSQIAFVKYRRSSLFVKPASCDTLFNRTSIKRLTPALLRRVKNVSADFLVKPIVKIFIRPLPSASYYPQARQPHKQCVPLVGGRRRPGTLRGNGTYRILA